MAFALGIRHGFDLDHLATIDSMTRAVKDNARLSKFVGFLFSLGHGIVVMVMSLVISSGRMTTVAPSWLAALGRWISIIFLLSFGLVTLWNVFFNEAKKPSASSLGVRVYVFRKVFSHHDHPVFIMLIGALFALSFDTFTQVALFSLSVSLMTGLFFSMTLAMVFMIGMIVADGLNGVFVSSLIHFTHNKSKIISQLMGLGIGCFSLILGLLGLVRRC